jgi:hypothetical protein
MGTCGGSCEHDNEPLGSIKFWEILEYLSDWRLLKKGSSPWSSVNSTPYSVKLLDDSEKWSGNDIVTQRLKARMVQPERKSITSQRLANTRFRGNE